MNAYEAKQMAVRNNLSGYQKIMQKIKESAIEGKLSMTWYEPITDSVVKLLTDDGYMILEQDEELYQIIWDDEQKPSRGTEEAE